jgi:lipase chaperone LimK
MIEVPLEKPAFAKPAKTTPLQVNDTTTVSLDGFALTLDSGGALIPTPAIRKLFDQIAIEHGKTPVDHWKGSVLTAYKDKLTPGAHSQLQSMLNHYIEYNLALQMLPTEGVPSLSSALERIKSMRKDYLGLTNADGMFSDWVQLEQFSKDYLSLMLTEKNPNQVKQLIQEKIDSLPETVQPRAQNVLDQSQELLSTLAVALADPEGFRILAEQTAALALIQPNFTFAEPDPEFMKRYEEYQAARDQIFKGSPNGEKQAEEVQHLRNELFSGSELLRVETLDRAESL